MRWSRSNKGSSGHFILPHSLELKVQRMANLDWATNVDLAFSQQDKKTDFSQTHC